MVLDNDESAQINTERADRIGSALRESAEFDALVLTSPTNTWYASGAVIPTQKTLPDRLGVVIWPREEEPAYFVSVQGEIQAKAVSWIKDVRSYFEFVESPMQLTAQVIKEKGLDDGRLGIETDSLTAHYYKELEKLLPRALLLPCQSLMQRVRMTKTPQEIVVLEGAAQATDRAIRAAFEAVRIGDTEREISCNLQSLLLRNGADGMAFVVLGAGKNSCMADNIPGEHRVGAGEVVRIDLGGVFTGGYLSDIARTMVVGRPKSDQLDIYRKLWDIHQHLIDMFQPGVRLADIYNRCRELQLEAGMPFNRPHIGHGLGIELHEHPLINGITDMVLSPNMVVAIEPTHMVPGVEKYHVEDLILVTGNGPQVLSRSADWQDLLRSG